MSEWWQEPSPIMEQPSLIMERNLRGDMRHAMTPTASTPAPDRVIFSSRNLAEIDDRLASLQQAVRELEHDAREAMAALDDNKLARNFEHVASDASDQADDIEDIRSELLKRAEQPQPTVVWSVG
jgi:hypothetical protein